MWDSNSLHENTPSLDRRAHTYAKTEPVNKENVGVGIVSEVEDARLLVCRSRVVQEQIR